MRHSRRLREAPLEFKVGDKVVYPNHGVGVIEQVALRSIGEVESSFYCLRILSTDSTVMVPVQNTQTVGLYYLKKSFKPGAPGGKKAFKN